MPPSTTLISFSGTCFERVKEMAELWHEYAEEVGYDPNAKGPTR